MTAISPRTLLRRPLREKRDFDMDVRIVRPDGSVRYVHSLGRPVLDEKGEVVELMGVVMDIHVDFHFSRESPSRSSSRRNHSHPGTKPQHLTTR